MPVKKKLDPARAEYIEGLRGRMSDNIDNMNQMSGLNSMAAKKRYKEAQTQANAQADSIRAMRAGKINVPKSPERSAKDRARGKKGK